MLSPAGFRGYRINAVTHQGRRVLVGLVGMPVRGKQRLTFEDHLVKVKVQCQNSSVGALNFA